MTISFVGVESTRLYFSAPRSPVPSRLGAAALAIVYPSSGRGPRKVTAFRDFVIERRKARPLEG
jgi:hypothetical protein